MESEPAPRTVASRSDRWLRWEVLLVLGVSLGMSGIYSLVNLIGRLTAPERLGSQRAVLNASRAPDRPWLDLSYQLLDITSSVVPALLAVFLLVYSGRSARSIGLDRTDTTRDVSRGAILAAIIGIPGLGLYLAAHAMGISAEVVPADLPDIWWRYPVLVLSALQNAVLEEIVVVAYLFTRLRQLRWREQTAIGASAVLRGSYHLYQGFGGFIGNAIMGVIFAYLFARTRRVLPLVIAHAVIDTVSFVGYTALADKVSWL